MKTKYGAKKFNKFNVPTFKGYVEVYESGKMLYRLWRNVHYTTMRDAIEDAVRNSDIQQVA